MTDIDRVDNRDHRPLCHAEARTFRLTPSDGKLIPVTAQELIQIRQEQSRWASALAASQAVRKSQITDLFQKAVAEALVEALKNVEAQMLKLDLQIRSGSYEYW